MMPLLEALLMLGLSALGKLIDKFFKSTRGKKVKDALPSAAQIVAIIAAKTDTKIDDTIAAVIRDYNLSGSAQELLSGKWGDIILREVSKRLLQEQRSELSDSEANLAIELSLNQLKAGSEGGLKS